MKWLKKRVLQKSYSWTSSVYDRPYRGWKAMAFLTMRSFNKSISCESTLRNLVFRITILTTKNTAMNMEVKWMHPEIQDQCQICRVTCTRTAYQVRRELAQQRRRPHLQWTTEALEVEARSQFTTLTSTWCMFLRQDSSSLKDSCRINLMIS